MAKKKSYGLSAACCCRKGIRNLNNEDNFYFYGEMLPELNHGLSGTIDGYSEFIDYPVIFGVFDGAGGEEDGQTASLICAETCRDMIGDWKYRSEESMEEFMLRIVLEANRRVCEARSVRIEDMGSSFSALLFYDDSVTVCNVGGGRLFAADRRDLIDISVDHSKEMSKEKKKRSLFKRKKKNEDESLLPPQYIGMDPEGRGLEPYIKTYKLSPNLRLMICSDGITEVVPEEELAYDLTKIRDDIDCAETVIDDALDFEVEDDATVIVVSLKKPGARKTRKAAPFFSGREKTEGEAEEAGGYPESPSDVLPEENTYAGDSGYGEAVYGEAEDHSGYFEEEAPESYEYAPGDYEGVPESYGEAPENSEEAVYGEMEAYGRDDALTEEEGIGTGPDQDGFENEDYGTPESDYEIPETDSAEPAEEAAAEASGKAAKEKASVITKISGLFADRFKRKSKEEKEDHAAGDLHSEEITPAEIFADEDGDSEKAYAEALGMNVPEESAETGGEADEMPAEPDEIPAESSDNPEDSFDEESIPDIAEAADEMEAGEPDGLTGEDKAYEPEPAAVIDEEISLSPAEESDEGQADIPPADEWQKEEEDGNARGGDPIESFLKDMDPSDE